MINRPFYVVRLTGKSICKKGERLSPDIAIVVVNWNKKESLVSLLSDLQCVDDPKFDIFVIDNASTDGSAKAVCNRFPDITLVENAVNLGGTGGFNTGIEKVLEADCYRFIWLLDNDAKITKTTLSELMIVMSSDDRIGMVGSRIVDIEAPEITVETGAVFRWDIMGTTPLNRNSKEKEYVNVPVDYVAICSAIVRVDAIRCIGLMDQRLFLFWDDMEWGIRFKEHGYVVSVAAKSIVYHASFTERNRGATTYWYYGIRNPFLVYSNHTGIFQRAYIFYRSLRCHLHAFIFLKLNGQVIEAQFIKKALFDFLQNKWGKFKSVNDAFSPPKLISSSKKLGRLKSILISGSNINQPIANKIINVIKKEAPSAKFRTLDLSENEMTPGAFIYPAQLTHK